MVMDMNQLILLYVIRRLEEDVMKKDEYEYLIGLAEMVIHHHIESVIESD